MMVFLQLFTVALILFVPAFLLDRQGMRLSWPTRYALAIAPVAITYLGWQFGAWAHSYFECGGNSKMIRDCLRWGYDFTRMVGFSIFLMIPCVFIALPVSLFLLCTTGLKQIASRNANK